MLSHSSAHWLLLKRIVRFGDTDAAGVMHFFQLLRWCHEAWEESLQIYGIKASDVFPSCEQINNPDVALPIIHCEADFSKPLKTGDHLVVKLSPEKIDTSCFEVKTEFCLKKQIVAVGTVRHLAINSQSRKRCNMPEAIELWLEASSLNFGLRPL